ncbi:unnamed protein product [Ambrosiozyma monospora]|uniref:DNA-directed RNA polymerase subunit n=1 Tax=Ambrosiozyma monospora TaxID=43982 RepID=A0A9W6WIC8_AMBMO|nr:unnamed protein product [Ambrosiozyma monospora]
MRPLEGIKKQHLDPLVMTYFKSVKGVVLAYFDVQLSEKNQIVDEATGETRITAKVSDSNPFSFLWCTVDFLVWRPQVGDIVEGWSYMQSPSHIGLLISDTFNASIKKFNIPPDWQFIPGQADEFEFGSSAQDGFDKSAPYNKSMGQWVDENEVPVEGKLQFTIKGIHIAGKVISIDGTLLKPGFEKESLPVERETNKHKKFDDDALANESAVVENIEESDKKDVSGFINKNDDSSDDSSSEDDKVVGGEVSSSEEDSD